MSSNNTQHPSPKLAQLRDQINHVSSAADALIELLWVAGNNPISPESVHTLLEPIAEELGHVRSSMADMRL